MSFQSVASPGGNVQHRNWNLFLGDMGESFPLSPFTAGIGAAYSLTRVLSATRAIRIQRPSDLVEQDFGFNPDGSFNSVAYLAFIGAESGNVVRWYDQSGNGNDLVIGPAPSIEWRIGNAGVYFGAVRSAGGGGIMSTVFDTPAVAALSILLDLIPISFSGLEFIATTPNTTGTAQALGASLDYSNASLANEKLEAALTSLGAGGRVQFTYGELVTTVRQILGVRYDRAAGLNPDKIALFVNGGQRQIVTTILNEVPGPLFDTEPWVIGGPDSGANFNADFRTVVLYNTAVSNADLVAITTALGISVPTTDASFASVVLLMHCDGADGSVVFTDSSSFAQTIAANGNAQIDTAQFVFGGASALFDGNGDYLTDVAAQYATGVADFTIEFWMRPVAGGGAGEYHIFQTRDGVGNGFVILRNVATGVVTFATDTGIAGLNSVGAVPLDSWTYIAVTRIANTFRFFVNGDVRTTVVSAQSLDTTNLVIGRRFTDDVGEFRYYAGHLDDIRFTNGVGRYSANFAPPAGAFPNSA